MRTGIHPDYVEATVTCSCGNTFQTRATKPEIHIELCNECHPFFTGRQKLVDSGGRVERFQRRYGRTSFGSKDAARAAGKEPARAAEEESATSVEEAPASEVAEESTAGEPGAGTAS